MSHGTLGHTVRVVALLGAVAVWVAAAFYLMPLCRAICGTHGQRSCFACQEDLNWARSFYEQNHGSPVTEFDPATRQTLLTERLIKNHTAWPDDPGEGPGTGDHYVIIPDTRAPVSTDPAAPPELRVACVRHGFPGPCTTVRQQFIDAGVTDEVLLARTYPGSPKDFHPTHPLQWLVHPVVGPLLLGAILFLLVRRVFAA